MEIKDYSIHTTKKANGRYYGRIIYRDNDGKRHEKSAGGFKLKKDAVQHAQEVLQSMLNSAGIKQNDISLYDYYIKWYQIYKEPTISRRTQLKYHCTGVAIKSYFKETPLRNIHRTDYQQFINWYGKNHVRSTVSKVHNAVKTCANYAIDDGIITKDFTHNVQITANDRRKMKVEYLNENEIKTLLHAVTAKLKHYNTGRYMILTALLTGMRKGEIQALTWNDIDFIHQTITIDKAWDDGFKCFKPTKTKASNRTIKVDPQLLNYLKELRANGTTMIFQNVLGTIPTSNALNKLLRSIMKDCGISKQGFHFHSLRHCHVALMLNMGFDIYAISKRLGHGDIGVTMHTYAYIIDELKAKNDEQIVSKFSKLW